MRKLLNFALLCGVFVYSCLLLNSCSKGDDDEKNLENINVLDKIKDPNFKACILRFIELGKIEAASPDKLTGKEATQVKLLHIYSWNIKSLEGLEYFTGLIELDCSKNKLGSLDLSKNTKLEKLRCNECELTSLNVSNNKELQSLQCWINNLESIDVSKCPKLTIFECDNNKLTKLDVSNNKELRYFVCSDNNISGIIDISACSVIREIKTSQNPIAAIKLNPAIEYLTCVLNDLSELDLSKCTNLKKIMCTRNPKMLSLDITNNRKLTNVTCGGISSEPPITLYVWWDVDPNNMWASRPKEISIGVGYNGVMQTKK
ncbi:MAG: hypothetical protein E6767_09900 [Dysgonomonas sp.]|nr:hypothetical protein [Dysgonomonas sp.]